MAHVPRPKAHGSRLIIQGSWLVAHGPLCFATTSGENLGRWMHPCYPDVSRDGFRRTRCDRSGSINFQEGSLMSYCRPKMFCARMNGYHLNQCGVSHISQLLLVNLGFHSCHVPACKSVTFLFYVLRQRFPVSFLFDFCWFYQISSRWFFRSFLCYESLHGSSLIYQDVTRSRETLELF